MQNTGPCSSILERLRSHKSRRMVLGQVSVGSLAQSECLLAKAVI